MSTNQYGGFLTDKGAAKQVEAASGGLRRNITHMLIGDAGGAPGETPDPVPSPSQTKLVRQRYRVKLNRLVAADNNPSVLIAEAILPQDVGGWWMRELGLEDSDGDMIAVANCAPSYKPLVNEGSGRTQTVRLHIAFSHAETVELLIDPNVVTATVADLQNALLEVRATNDATGQMTRGTDGKITLPLSLSLTGIAAGTYRSLTVDAKGRATSGSNPTTLGGYGITDALAKSDAVDAPAPNKLLRLNAASQLPASITGNAATATKLAVPRMLSFTGDATGSASFDGECQRGCSADPGEFGGYCWHLCQGHGERQGPGHWRGAAFCGRYSGPGRWQNRFGSSACGSGRYWQHHWPGRHRGEARHAAHYLCGG